MQIDNPFQMNDWNIKKFLHIILAIQLAMWGFIGLDTISLQFPILRQLVGFIYLSFIPGIIILRILKLHKLGNIETLLYSAGLSISLLMFTGFLMNMAYPLIGISKPISLIPLIITISAVVLILCALSYMRDKEFSDPSCIELRDVLSPPVLFLCTLPLLAVFGTYLVNYYQSNILLMFLLILISLIAILIGFDKFIPTKSYSLAVFVISISLLFHNALISMYIWGWDIHLEYYIANLVISDSLWDSTIYSNVNAMLSIVMLAPIFSAITDMNLTWVFKIIYPLLFSLVPLGLYRVFQKQTDDKIAFLSVFFFMSIIMFYVDMLQLARQQIAELFLVLIVLLFIDKNMNKVIRSVLLIVFAFSLGVSHYGLSYIFMASLIVVWAILYFYGQWQNKKTIGINTSFVLLFVTFVISWYMYISSSSSLNSIIYIGNHAAQSLFSDFLNPEFAQGAAIILKKTMSPLYGVGKYLHLIAQFFIGIGILTLILNRSKMTFEKEYAAFSVVNFIILLCGIAVPFVASSLNTSRLYQISLIFLAPFCVIGGITFFNLVIGMNRSIKMKQHNDQWLKILSLFLVIFLLFNSGWVYEVAKDNSISISLSAIDFPVFNEQEVTGAKWLNNVKAGRIYGDYFRWLLINSFEWGTVSTISDDLNKIKLNSYVYLGTFNIREETVLISHKKGVNRIREYINSSNIMSNGNKIYDNNGSEVYYL